MLEQWNYIQCRAYATQGLIAYNWIFNFFFKIRFILKALELRKHATTYCGVVWIIVSCKTLARWLKFHTYHMWPLLLLRVELLTSIYVKAVNLTGPSRTSDFKTSTSFRHCTTHHHTLTFSEHYTKGKYPHQ